jgi:hypothetical protein
MDPAARRDARLLARFRVLALALVVPFAVAELFAACAICVEPLSAVVGAHGFGEFFAMAMLGTFVAHLWCRPPRVEAIAAVLAAVVAEAIRVAMAWRAGWDATSIALHTGLGAGLASLVVQTFFAARSRGEARTERLVVLYACVLIDGFVLLSGPFVTLTTALHPRTIDGLIYAFDASLGVQWSFVVGRLFHALPALERIATLFYLATPFGFALVWAAARRARQAPPIDIVSAFLVASVAGLTLYHAMPVVGPRYVIDSWPASAPPPSALGLAPALAPTLPRNCMPSLHTAWALLLWWHSRERGLFVRALAGAFLGFTLLATLGLGYHYAIDLVVAVPFAAAAQAAVAPASPARRRTLVATIAMVALWMALLRAGLLVRHPHALLSWALVVAGTAAALWLERDLWRVSAVVATTATEAVPLARRDLAVAIAWLAAGFALVLAFGSPAPALLWPLAVSFAVVAAAAHPAVALGGALASLLAAHALVPAVGVRATRLVAVALFLLVGLAARRLWRRPAPDGDRAPATTALAALAPALAAALALVYVPLAALVLGDTVYGYATTAACLLGGFALGALAPRVEAAWSLLAAALCILAALFVWPLVPGYFASYEHYLGAPTFGGHEVVRFVAAALVLMPPMACLGAAAARLRATTPSARAIAAAASLVAALAGARLAAAAGALHALQLLGALAALAGLAALARVPADRRRFVVVPLAGIVALAAASPHGLDPTRLGTRAHVFFAPPTATPPPTIWVAGAASAYNRERYAAADGVVERRLPSARLAPLDFAYAVGSLHSVFPFVRLTVAGDELVLLGCARECPPAPALLDTAGCERMLAGAARSIGAAPDELVSTDDNRWLEYHTPRATPRPYRPSLRFNLDWLRSFAAP